MAGGNPIILDDESIRSEDLIGPKLSNLALKVLDGIEESLLVVDELLVIRWANKAALTNSARPIGTGLKSYLQKAIATKSHYSDAAYNTLEQQIITLLSGQCLWTPASGDNTETTEGQNLSFSWERYHDIDHRYITIKIVHRGRRWKDPGIAKMRQERQQSFTNKLAHEIRTPIAITRGYLRRAKAATLVDNIDAASYIQAAMEEVERLNRMFSNIAILTDIESDLAATPLKPISASTLLAAWLRKAGSKGWDRVRHSFDEPLENIYLHANQDLFNIAMDNIVDNAHRYDARNQPIRLHIKTGEDWLHVYIADWGPGIPEKVKLSIANRSQHRVEHHNSTGTEGAGLGLAVAQKMMADLNGRLDIVRSHKGTDADSPTTIIALSLRIAGHIPTSTNTAMRTESPMRQSLEAGKEEKLLDLINKLGRGAHSA